MIITVTKQELCDMLEVSKKTISNMKEDKLRERLLGYGYKLIKSYKQGRDKFYELEYIEEITWKVIQNKYSIRDKIKHSEYSRARLTSGLQQSRKGILNDLAEENINVSYNSAMKYDKILIKERIMEHDGEVYYMFNPKTNQFIESTKEEYTMFWVYNKEFKRQITSIKNRRNIYEISESAYDILISATYKQYGFDEECIAIKFNTYREVEITKQILEEINSSLLSE